MSANMNPENNERWLSDGYCAACRRFSYCKKPCKAQKKRKQEILRMLAESARIRAAEGQSDIKTLEGKGYENI